MLTMQHQEPSNGHTAGRLPNYSKSSMSADHTGGFHHHQQHHHHHHHHQQSIGGYADRHPQRTNIPNINTARLAQGHHHVSDMQTPGTAFGEMNFTPLLPSQLLLGSPFQPGSPATFGASPQFQGFSNFSGQPTGAQQAQSQLSPIQSPQMYSSIMSPTSLNPSSYFTPQSPTGGVFPGLSNNGLGGLGATGMMGTAPGLVSGTSRTVYLGNIPPDTSAEEILGHVRSGQIESVRLLPDKNCAFISFLDSSSATHFHSDAILKKLAIKGQDIKIGWGKPSQVPTSVALAVQQSGASRNVYLGNLPEDIVEHELREDLGKFGPIDTVKIVREKSIAFVHFLSIGNAIKAVAQLPQEAKWQPPRRVYYGKDRCAYVSKTQQQNAAQYLGIAPGYAHVLNSADRDMITNALAQQTLAAAQVATTAGGINNLGNRTVYLGNIHPETTIEEICNVVRGGLLHHIRYIPDKHICFVTFIDPTSAASFYALSNLQGLMIHNRRLKIGWGKHSGALPPAIAMAVSGGASRNVYIGNLDESWTEERLRQDFSEYGEIELVNTLREKSCAFVNFTNIANAIKAIEAVRGRDEYKRFKVNFGKDRCGNPPRQLNNQQQQQNQQNGTHDDMASPSSLNGLAPPRGPGATVSPTGSTGASSSGQFQVLQAPSASTILSAGGRHDPMVLYLQQAQTQQLQGVGQQSHTPQSQNGLDNGNHAYGVSQQQPSLSHPSQPQHSQHQSFSNAQAAFYSADPSPPQINTPTTHTSSHGPSASFSLSNGTSGLSSSNGTSSTIGGLLAPRTQHTRAVSLPAFSQGPFSQPPLASSHNSQASMAFSGLGAGLGGFGSAGNGYGLAIQGDQHGHGLPGWVEEEIGAQ